MSPETRGWIVMWIWFAFVLAPFAIYSLVADHFDTVIKTIALLAPLSMLFLWLGYHVTKKIDPKHQPDLEE